MGFAKEPDHTVVVLVAGKKRIHNRESLRLLDEKSRPHGLENMLRSGIVARNEIGVPLARITKMRDGVQIHAARNSE